MTNEITYYNTEYFPLPNISEFSKHGIKFIIGDNEYVFYFKKNFRSENIYLSISKFEDNEEIFLVRNTILTPFINLIKFVNKEDMDDLIVFMPIDLSNKSIGMELSNSFCILRIYKS